MERSPPKLPARTGRGGAETKLKRKKGERRYSGGTGKVPPKPRRESKPDLRRLSLTGDEPGDATSKTKMPPGKRSGMEAALNKGRHNRKKSVEIVSKRFVRSGGVKRSKMVERSKKFDAKSPWSALRKSRKGFRYLKKASTKKRKSDPQKVSLITIFKDREDIKNSLHGLFGEIDECEDLLQELRENLHNLRVRNDAAWWLRAPVLIAAEQMKDVISDIGGAATKRIDRDESIASASSGNTKSWSTHVPVLVYLHYYFVSVELRIAELLDRVHEVRIVPTVHGSELEDQQSSLAIRIMRLLHRVSRSRQRNQEILRVGSERFSGGDEKRQGDDDTMSESRRKLLKSSSRMSLTSSLSARGLRGPGNMSKSLEGTEWTTTIRILFERNSKPTILDARRDDAADTLVHRIQFNKGARRFVARVGLASQVKDVVRALTARLSESESKRVDLYAIVVAIADAKSLGLNVFRGDRRTRRSETSSIATTTVGSNSSISSSWTEDSGSSVNASSESDDDSSDSTSSSEEADDEEQHLSSVIRAFASICDAEAVNLASRGQWGIGVTDVINFGDHVRYVIEISAPDESTRWQVMYRFTAMKHLQKMIRASASQTALDKVQLLPKKGVLRSKNDPDVVEERCKGISSMLLSAIRTGILFRSVGVVRFFCSKRHMKETVSQSAGALGLRHDLIGWLHKLSPPGVTKLVGGWKRRYFVLLGNDLCYYVSRLEDLKGSINMRAVMRVGISATVRGPGDTSAFEVVTQDRVYTLCAQSDVANRRWIEAIAGVAGLVQTKSGDFTIPGLPLSTAPGARLRKWHRLLTDVYWIDTQRGRAYKSSRDNVHVHRLCVISRHHTWTLRVRESSFKRFHREAVGRTKDASLLADSMGGRDGWKLARQIDSILEKFPIRAFDRLGKKKRGKFIATFTAEIVRLNRGVKGIWDRLLESWLIHGLPPTARRHGSLEPVSGIRTPPDHASVPHSSESTNDDEFDCRDDDDGFEISAADFRCFAEDDRTASDGDASADAKPSIRYFDSQSTYRATQLSKSKIVSRKHLRENEYILEALTSWWVDALSRGRTLGFEDGTGFCIYLECCVREGGRGV